MGYTWNDGTSLYHFGIPGMKWGVRRYQNPDGTLTEEGKRRYRKLDTYRNTLASKSRRKAESSNARADEDKEHQDNIRNLGIRSQEYQDYVESQMRDTDEEWNDKDTVFYNKISNAIDKVSYYTNKRLQRETIDKLLKEYNDSETEWRKNAERWMRSNDALMNTKIDVLMSKKDIKKIMKNARY